MMTYYARLDGTLRFPVAPTPGQLARLEVMFHEDCREYPTWKGAQECRYIDLCFTEDMQGLCWNGNSEQHGKDMEQILNNILRHMRRLWPDFGFTGQLRAQGDAIGDCWLIVMREDGWAYKQPIALSQDAAEQEALACLRAHVAAYRERQRGKAGRAQG